MKRQYAAGDKLVEIEELDQLLAVMPSDRDQPRDEVASALGRKPAAPTADQGRDSWNAFENAGWIFVRPSADLRSAAESRSPVERVDAVARVFRRPDGQLMLGTDRLSIRLRDDMDEEEAQSTLDAHGLEVTHRFTFAPNMFEVSVPTGTDFLEASTTLPQQDEVLFAEPLFIERIPPRFTPTDPDYGQQWHLSNTGQAGGTAGADISAEEAWDTTRGAGTRIAVIDNGINVAHPDLAAAVLPTSGFFDTDAMGNAVFVQSLTNFPNALDIAGPTIRGHGTFCSGMAVARANNGQGGCGVANQAGLIALAALGDTTGTQATLARAVAYAADPTREVAGANPADGADVISCSLGPNGVAFNLTMTLQTAIDFAVLSGRGGLGTPVFWATDNSNVQVAIDEVCSYVNTIAVGRSTRTDLEDNSASGPELDFLATGVDVRSTGMDASGTAIYGNGTGTSYAAPAAAGIGALVISVAPGLTWVQVRDLLRATCDQIGGVVYDAAGHNNDYGFGRVNAAAAICRAAEDVRLETLSVAFSDVPEGETTARAVVFSVSRCGAATFQIVSGPTVTSGPGTFGTLPSAASVLPAQATPAERQARLWLSFTGTADGDITQGEMRVRLVETGQEWLIAISANTIARPTVAVVLSLDQSGSMGWASGLPTLPLRNDVLKFAAPVFVNVLAEDNSIGIVAFDHDPYVRMPVTTVGPPSPFDPARATALGVIGAHTPNPAGNTAIGDAVESASILVNAVTGFDHRALVVFTDGHETAEKYLSDVAPLINDRVFAIGLGTAEQIQPTALTALANGTGGYLLLTGAIGPDDLFRLSKYYLQILAGVTNQDIVLDPQGALQPGQTHEIPFVLNEADVGVDAVLMSEADLTGLFRWALRTPAGDLIDPANPAVEYIAAGNLSFYRMTLPVPIGAGAHTGTWHAVLALDERLHRRYLSELADQNPDHYQHVQAHGIRYNLSVQSFSGLRLVATVAQNSLQPGATLTLRGRLTEYGIPIEDDRATVTAQMTRPDSTTSLLTLTHTDPGIYTVDTPADLPGVYHVKVLANGHTLRARPFTREQLLTAATWRNGDQPPPHTDPRPDPDPDLCRLLTCLISDRVITPELQRRLTELGLDLTTLRACLNRWCTRQPPPRESLPASTPGIVGRTATSTSATVSPVISTQLADLARRFIRELELGD